MQNPALNILVGYVVAIVISLCAGYAIHDGRTCPPCDCPPCDS